MQKQSLPRVLANIHSFLKEKGYFYLTLRKGAGEALEKDQRYKGNHEKYVAQFEEEELKQLLQSAKFKVLECCSVHKKGHPILHILVSGYFAKSTHERSLHFRNPESDQ